MPFRVSKIATGGNICHNGLGYCAVKSRIIRDYTVQLDRLCYEL